MIDREFQKEWLKGARIRQGGGLRRSPTTGRDRPIWTQAQMSAWLREHGVDVDDASYRQWESGYKPVTSEYARQLEAVVGPVPAEQIVAAGESDGSPSAQLVDALNRQSKAIEDLVVELRESRGSGHGAELLQQIPWEKVGDMLAAIVEKAVEGRLAASEAVPAPRTPPQQ